MWGLRRESERERGGFRIRARSCETEHAQWEHFETKWRTLSRGTARTRNPPPPPPPWRAPRAMARKQPPVGLGGGGQRWAHAENQEGERLFWAHSHCHCWRIENAIDGETSSNKTFCCRCTSCLGNPCVPARPREKSRLVGKALKFHGGFIKAKSNFRGLSWNFSPKYENIPKMYVLQHTPRQKRHRTAENARATKHLSQRANACRQSGPEAGRNKRFFFGGGGGGGGSVTAAGLGRGIWTAGLCAWCHTLVSSQLQRWPCRYSPSIQSHLSAGQSGE